MIGILDALGQGPADKMFSTIKARAAVLFLFANLVKLSKSSEKNNFLNVLRTLISPYNFKRTERKPEPKEPAQLLGMSANTVEKKDKKAVVLVKLPHIDKFFEDYLGKDVSLLDFLANSVFITDSSLVLQSFCLLMENILE